MQFLLQIFVLLKISNILQKQSLVGERVGAYHMSLCPYHYKTNGNFEIQSDVADYM